MNVLRCLSVCFLVFFGTAQISATNPSNPTTVVDPCPDDKTPPVVKCPSNVTVFINCDEECTKVIHERATATDNCDPNPQIYYDVDDNYCYREGINELWAWAVDSHGNQSEKCGFLITVKYRTENKPPQIICPPNVVVYAECGEKCTTAKHGDSKVWDDCDPNPEVFYDVSETHCYREGTVEVWSWAVDKSGNQSEKCSFEVTVKAKPDTKAPRIKCPDNVVVYADCNEHCTTAKHGDSKVWDDCDPNPEVYYDVSDTHCYREGTVEVWSWAVDKSGNQSEKCAFDVTVKIKPDTKAPVITCDADVIVEIDCKSTQTCAKATFGIPTAKDNCDPNPKVWCDYSSGDCFKLGTTKVTCYAKDASGNQSSHSFNVIVKKADKVAPVISCRNDVDLYVECGYTCSRMMMWMDPTATDNCDPNPKVWCSITNKNYCFPLGKTEVICYAEDQNGNRSQCSYIVTVKVAVDYDAPKIACPADIMKTLAGRNMCEKVDFAATAKDNCSAATITYDYASGSCFPMGKTKVTATAKDKAGNESKCSFTITVMTTGDLVKSVDTNPTAAAVKNDNKSAEKANVVTTEDNTNLSIPVSQNLSRRTFSIYPNPTSTFVNVELQQYQGHNVVIQVLNAVGQKMYSATVKEVTDQTFQIDMQQYPSGMYLIHVTAAGLEPMAKKVMRR
jgi:hypothetical protein